MTHLKKFKVNGGTSNKVANFPIIKFPDQNSAAKVEKYKLNNFLTKIT